MPFRTYRTYGWKLVILTVIVSLIFSPIASVVQADATQTAVAIPQAATSSVAITRSSNSKQASNFSSLHTILLKLFHPSTLIPTSSTSIQVITSTIIPTSLPSSLPAQIETATLESPKAAQGSNDIYLPLVMKNYIPGPATGTDLSITITTGSQSVKPGATVIYTLSYKNNGPKNTSGVVLTDFLPANTTFNAADSKAGWQQVGSTNQYIYPVGSLASGASVQVVIALVVPNPVPQGMTAVTNSASIWDDGKLGEDPNTGNNYSSLTISINLPPGAPNLSVMASDGGVKAVPGGRITYTFQYANTGQSLSTGVTLTETIPPNTSFDQTGSDAGWQQVGTSSQYQFPVGEVTVNGNGTVHFAVVVATPVPAGVTSISNTVNIADDGTHGVDPDLANNTAQVITPIDAAPDLTLTLSAGIGTTTPGSILVYSLNYANQGNRGASGVKLTETIPTSTTLNVANSSTGWTLVAGSNTQYTFPLGTVEVGGHGTIQFAVNVTNPATAGVDSIANTATVTDDGTNGTDSNLANNTTSSSTTLVATPDLSVNLADGGKQATPGKPLLYTITYQNSGNQDASGVAITETLPANTTFDSTDSTPAWQEKGTSNSYTYAIGGLPAGGSSHTVVFAVMLANPVPNGINALSDTASIADDGANGADPTPTDNSATIVTTIYAPP